MPQSKTKQGTRRRGGARNLTNITSARKGQARSRKSEQMSTGRTHPLRESTKRSYTMVSPEVHTYAQLIADPCEGPLVRANNPTGIVGMIERTRVSYSKTSSGATGGYLIWYPGYFGAGTTSSGKGQNAFVYENSSTSTRPTNTGVAPLGSDSTVTTGLWITDPGFANVATDGLFSRAETLAACISAEYVGSLSSISGQVAIIANLPVDVLSPSSGANLVFPTVDELFDYASIRERLPLEGVEVVWRPSALGSKPRKGVEEFSPADSANVLFVSGEPDPTTGMPSYNAYGNDHSADVGICIAWRGVPNTAASLVFNLTKVASYTLSMKGKAIEQPVININHVGPSIVEQATAALDEWDPGWQKHLVKNGLNALKAYATTTAAFAGVPGMAMIADMVQYPFSDRR